MGSRNISSIPRSYPHPYNYYKRFNKSVFYSYRAVDSVDNIKGGIMLKNVERAPINPETLLGWQRALLIKLAALEKASSLVQWLDEDDGGLRRTLIDVAVYLCRKRLVKKIKKGKGARSYWLYEITREGRAVVDHWNEYLADEEAWNGRKERMPTLPDFAGWMLDGVMWGEMVDGWAPISQGDWVLSRLDYPSPRYCRLVIGIGSSGTYAITQYAYGWPHQGLMSDPFHTLVPVQAAGIQPFSSKEDMLLSLPKAPMWRTFNG